MADFRDQLTPTNDPNYLRQSKEPDRIRPLEQVSVPANTIADTSFGTLLQGLGNVTELGLSLVDNTIKQNVKDDARALIQPIQASHGSELQPGDVVPIAGTGAKGRARLSSAQPYNLFGDGGAGSSSYAPEDAKRDYAGLPAEVSTGRPLPQSAEIELNRVSRMNVAYQNGTMSDSYYNSQLVSVVSKLRARYPGYTDEVDAAVSNITGVVPANALRRSLLSDLNANAAARAGGASDEERLYQKNATSITTVAPDFFSNRSAYIGREKDVLQQAYVVDANRASVTAGVARLGYDTSNAGVVMTDAAVNVTREGLARINNTPDPQTGKTVNQMLNELSKKGGGTPEEIGIVTNTLENIKRQLIAGINSEFTDPARGAGGKTLIGIGGNANAKAAQEAALAPIDAAIAQAKAGNIPMLKTITDRLELTKSAEAQRQIDSNPATKFISGLSKAGGDALVNQAFQGTNLLPIFQKGLAEDKILQSAQGKAKPISEHLDEMEKAGVKGGKVQTALVKGNLAIMNTDALGPDASAAAVKSLFDQKFFAGLPEREQMKTFLWLSKPANTARIAELEKQSPGLLRQYSDWSKYAAQTVISRGISLAQQAAEDDRFKIGFDPKTLQITMEPTETTQRRSGYRNTAIGNGYVSEVNQVLRIMGPIFKAQGADPVEAARGWLSDINIQTENRQGTPNPVLKRVTDTIRDLFSRPKEGERLPPVNVEPHQTRGVIRGNLSDQPLGAPVLTN